MALALIWLLCHFTGSCLRHVRPLVTYCSVFLHFYRLTATHGRPSMAVHQPTHLRSASAAKTSRRCVMSPSWGMLHASTLCPDYICPSSRDRAPKCHAILMLVCLQKDAKQCCVPQSPTVFIVISFAGTMSTIE